MDETATKVLGLVKQLSADQQDELHKSLSNEIDKRRPRVQLEDIRPGMSAETEQAAREEIRRVLKGIGL